MSNADTNNPHSVEMTEEIIRNVGLHTHGPDWRWQRAENMIRSGRTSNSDLLGPTIWHIVHHARPLGSAFRSKYLTARDVDVSGAKTIHGNRMKRLEVESRLLAGMSFDEVASTMDLSAELVRDYGEIFFDVRPSLNASSWIMQQIETEDNDYLRRTLYRHAYLGGPEVCQYWLDRLGCLGEEHDLSTERGREVERLDQCIRLEQFRDEPWSDQTLGNLMDLMRPEPSLPDTVDAMMSQQTLQAMVQELARIAAQVESKEVPERDRSQTVA
ncbi:MAG: hypothetical protein NXI28_15905 [bacterium]|nr:hypothetical protein [bacterium]